jgi:hypothetical protein
MPKMLGKGGFYVNTDKNPSEVYQERHNVWTVLFWASVLVVVVLVLGH